MLVVQQFQTLSQEIANIDQKDKTNFSLPTLVVEIVELICQSQEREREMPSSLQANTHFPYLPIFELGYLNSKQSKPYHYATKLSKTLLTIAQPSHDDDDE